jgi:IS30 family transposase
VDQTQYNTVKKKWTHISEKDRYKIEALFEQGLTPAQIGVALTPQRDRRTIERELAIGMVNQKRANPSHNKYEPMHIIERVYKADYAQLKRTENADRKGRGLKIGRDQKLADYIEDKIKNERWSPDAIIGRIKAEGPEFETKICTKMVQSYIDNGIFRDVTNKDLWVKKNKRKHGHKKIRTVALNNMMGKSISERPEVANNRQEKGHWEIDLVVGKQGTKPVILTLVERVSRNSLYILVKNKTQKEVIAAIKRARRRVGGDFSDVFKSITADNGPEFLDGEAIKAAAKCGDVYYAHPYSS